MASEVKTITSESLEAAYRALTPSQSGFTQDLMASNTIIPVLDLTASAEGTSTPELLMTALAFGSQTAFQIENASVTIANTTGFWRVTAVATNSSVGTTLNLNLSDGLSNKTVWSYIGSASNLDALEIDLVFFLGSGEFLFGTSDIAGGRINGSVRQIADVNGNLVAPAGFTPQ